MSAANGAGARPAVEVRDLCVSMIGSGVPIVSGVSFDVAERETLGLVGESGSGKSTVAVALLGFARPGLEITGGSVRIGEVEVLDLKDEALREARGELVSYVPQDPAAGLNPAHRIGTQLREAFQVHEKLGKNELRGRIEELLKAVNLPTDKQFLRCYPHQLSGGQQQRVVIAIAFACRPRLIVLDEPTTGLDVTTQRYILETINDMAANFGASAVYVSHDLPAVAEVAARTAVMYAGRIVEVATTEQLFSQPRHPYSAGLLNAAPSAHQANRLVGIEGRPPRPGHWPQGCSYAPRCPHARADCRQAVPPLAPTESGSLVRCLHPMAVSDGGVLRLVPSPKPEVKGGEALEIERLVADYGGRQILHEVGFAVKEGECTAVVGESGSGKTTLARCLVGLHTRWDGEIRLDGESLRQGARERSREQLRRMQYIFQNPFGSLNPTMTVAENIEEPLRHFESLSRNERRAKALEVLGTVHLGEDFADVLPGRISGGERQRVAVGRALVVNPEVLVCDEITSALDVSVQALLVEQLRDLQMQRGLTMVFITHNLAVVRSIAQNVIVLQTGTIVEAGSVEGVLSAPKHPYTRQLLEDLPTLDPAEQATAGGAK
ncbi:MAG: ABC transporter ATP-binding protein [Actinobacteria bacterium]|nr:ABC transporter ATP-binding protein [Actinomycetota bacterium]